MKQVILFKGSSCAPCKVFEPVFFKIMEEHGAELNLHVETDNHALMSKYGVRAVPTVVMAHILPDGKEEVEQILTGAIRSKTLEDAVHRFKHSVAGE